MMFWEKKEKKEMKKKKKKTKMLTARQNLGDNYISHAQIRRPEAHYYQTFQKYSL